MDDRCTVRTSPPGRERPASAVPSAHLSPTSGPHDASLSRVQAKLRVGAVTDPEEREADDIARLVMSRIAAIGSPPLVASTQQGRVRRAGHDLPIHDPAAAGPPPSKISRSAAHIGSAGGELDEATDQHLRQTRGRGASLPDAVRTPMEGAFGVDFGGVRVHHGAEADHLSREMGASAFTVGSDVYFRSGEFTPASSGGMQLLAHELTHVVQQSGAAQRSISRIRRGPSTAGGQKGEAGADPTITETAAGGGRSRLEMTDASGRIGSVTLGANDKGVAAATDLEVSQAHRGAGHGQQLLAAAGNAANQLGQSRIQLASGDRGSGRLDQWYRSLGFQETGATSDGHTRFEARSDALVRRMTGPAQAEPTGATNARDRITPLRLNARSLPIRRMEVDHERFEIESDQFGETYHAAAAMIVTSGAIVPDVTNANDSQRAFLARVLSLIKKYEISVDELVKDYSGKSMRNVKKASKNDATKRVADAIPDKKNDQKGYLEWLRESLLGGDSLVDRTCAYLDKKFDDEKINAKTNKAVIFYRNKKGDQAGGRNMTSDLLQKIVTKLKMKMGVTTLLIVGDDPGGDLKGIATDLGCTLHKFNFFGDKLDTGDQPDAYTFQLNVYRQLHEKYGVKIHVGMKSGAMDGPALVGVPTVFVDTTGTDKGRMGTLAKALPNLERQEPPKKEKKV